MVTPEEMLTLDHPEPGKSGPRMRRFKFEAYRVAILAAVPADDDGITFQDLPGRVRDLLPQDRLNELGKVTWHVVSVKLHLEAEGLIERVPGAKPQRLRRTNSASG